MVTNAAETKASDATPKSQRRRRSATSGLALKLDAPQRPGYVRRFVDNSPARILQMQDLGYAIVPDRAGDAETRTDGVGSVIQRLGGKRDDGQPQHLVLMETPAEEYRHGVDEKEDALKPFEEAIRRGADTTGRVQDSYAPRDGSAITTTAGRPS